jgi:hypothetical protein
LGQEEEAQSPGTPESLIIQSQYQHDNRMSASRKQSMPMQDYQQATERNYSLKLSPKVTSRREIGETFSPSPLEGKSVKRVSQQ